ncbi:MAG: hypothetical protein EOO56_29840 [Hymenobacter sp.]|nr:MAG: hypothetical protein EOO56_29840 [Hymenobacter sp.]
MTPMVFENVQLTLREYIRVNLVMGFKAAPMAFTIRCFLPILATGFFYQIYLPQVAADIPRVPVLLGFLLLMLGAVGFGWYASLKRSYLNLPIPREPATLRFDANYIQVDSASTQARTAWPASGTLYLIKPHAILMNSPVTGYYLDFRCLKQPADSVDFLALVRQQDITIK